MEGEADSLPATVGSMARLAAYFRLLFSGTAIMPLTANLDRETLDTLPADVAAPALALALAEIQDDSVASADTYLRDTVVPHGGE
jgi:hypothetical protein